MNTTSRILGEAMTPRQKRIYKDPVRAVRWAVKHGQRFPEAEPYILKDPHMAYEYAINFIVGRWPEAEATIAKSPYSAYYYAKDVIGGRWPEVESVIAKDPWSAYYYAKDVIGGRWPEAEATIVTDPNYAHLYLNAFPEAKLEWAMNGWIDWTDL